MPRSDFHKAGFFRSLATVFKISRESSSSDTARAMPMAPTSAQYVMIARDLAVPLPLRLVPRIRVASNSMLFRIFWNNSPRALASAREVWRQSGDRTARAGMIAMCFGQINIDERIVRHGRPTRSGGIDPIFPHVQRGADRFAN